MPFDLDTLASSRLGLAIAASIGRTTPPAAGYRIADAAASMLVSANGSGIVTAVRANQWVASGGTLAGSELDELVLATLRSMARGLFELYHVTGKPARLEGMVRLVGDSASWLERSRAGEPVVFAGPHLSNFDLVGRALAVAGWRPQVLSVPAPTGQYRDQNQSRRELGIEITPISLGSLRAAEERLAAGGCVYTGIDRPVPDSRVRPRFFGREASLPTVHVKLAASSGASLVVLCVHRADDGVYEVETERVEMAPGRAAVRANAEAVLAVAERAIRARPEQWAMPHAVWPQAVAELAAAERTGEHPRA